ncbi:hypothetical protein N7486_005062 [Penicillium sp. IBT 16267x]|nr:hypothetical protein N7486_005062 [Penicillium sp. IBT 16267x]
MVQTRYQARLKAQSDERKDTTVNSRVQKLPQNQRTQGTPKRKGSNGSPKKPSLASQVHRLLDEDASEDDFKNLLTKSKDELDFLPPLAFDNIYTQDVFHRAIHKQRLDALPWMLERQDLDNWNTLHLAVVYDKLELVKKLGNKIPELGCAVDRSGRTPLHLAFIKCNAQVARFLLESNCWNNYHGDDRNCLGHLTVEALAFDYRKSGMCEWASLVRWLYDEGGMVTDTENSNGETAIDLARKWDIFDVRVKYPLMGWK